MQKSSILKSSSPTASLQYFSRFSWEYIVYVREAPLTMSGIAGRVARTAYILDGHFSIPHQSYLYLDGDIYYRTQEIEAYATLLQRHSERIPLMLELIKNLSLRFAKKESKFSARVLQGLSVKELIEVLHHYELCYQNALSTLYAPVALDRMLSNKLREYLHGVAPHKVEEYFRALTPLTKAHDVVQYYAQLYKIALRKNQLTSQELQKELEHLAHKYAYFGIKFYYGTPYTLATVQGHFLEVLTKDPEEHIAAQHEAQYAERLQYKKIVQQLSLPSHVMHWVQWLGEAIYLRTYRLERLSEGEHNSFVLLNEIGRRLRMDGKDLVHCMFPEITSALLGTLDLAPLVAVRTQPFGAVWVGDKSAFCFGRDYPIWKKAFQKVSSVTSKNISGQVAYPGVVQGKVRLVWEDEDLKNVCKGEILVTRMTTPDYIFAMQKAAAIVTDVGGVTCHASVVSRELRKPCVMGCRNATKILKTGDRVEVDANQGVVRILT